MQASSSINQHKIQFANQIIRRADVVQLTGISETTIWRMESKGRFPKAVKLTNRCVGYRKSDIEEWLQSPSEFLA